MNWILLSPLSTRNRQMLYYTKGENSHSFLYILGERSMDSRRDVFKGYSIFEGYQWRSGGSRRTLSALISFKASRKR